MNRRLPVVGLLVVVALAAWWFYGKETASGPLRLYGNVDIREVDLAFRVAGRLDSLERDEGDPVAAGDLLARLDEEPLRENLAVAEAQVAQAQAQLDKLQAGSRPQEIRRAEAHVAEAEAALANAEAEQTRLAELIVDGATSQRELDAVQAQASAAAARLSAAREELALLREGFRKEDIAAARAALALAQARAEQARTALDDARLLAPSGGTVLTRLREPGSILGAGQTVYTLSLDHPVWVRAYVDEPHLGEARPGRAVVLRSDSAERDYHGQVGFVSPRAEFTPRAVETESQRSDLVYRLRIVVEDPDEALRQGMPVTVTFDDKG